MRAMWRPSGMYDDKATVVLRGGLFLLAVHRGLEASRLTGKAQQHIEIEIYLIQPLPLFECAL
jgi:hypothetical protein